MYKILCIGPQWRGSNAGGLFRAFSRNGHLISVVDEYHHIPLAAKGYSAKITQKLFRNIFIGEFNNKILKEADLFKPDFVLVYKGAFVKPVTLNYFRNLKIPIVNFYPDVSFVIHGPRLKATLPLYDHVFTTKTFGIRDMKEKLGITNSSFIPHGFDPEIHRPIDVERIDTNEFSCDVSFIGGYSRKKEQMLRAIKRSMPDIKMKIWGPRWESAKSPELSDSIQLRGIFGDLYALGIGSSKINLALLHEQVTGSSSGDKITSRTFHIPASGGFMIHERTEEVMRYFKEDKEIICYENDQELVNKIKYYLENPGEREKMRHEGFKRAVKNHSLDQRAGQIIEVLEEKNIL